MSHAEQICRAATVAAHLFYAERHAALRDRGYAVMYGPPLPHAPVLFVGYQPGGRQITDVHLRAEPTATPWPSVNEYATDNYPLAARLQEVFGKPLLRRCTAVNALFACSPSVSTYRTEVPLAVRRDVTSFCLPWVRRIVAAVAPRLVFAIGLDTLELFGPSQVALRNETGRALVTTGEIGGIQALGTLHLSGARIATADRDAITRHLRDAVRTLL